MSNRICPQCRAEIPAAIVAARSNSIECPRCGARLEVTPVPRAVSTAVGFAAAALVWWLTDRGEAGLGGVLPTLYAVLAFGIVSPLALMFTANLRNAPAPPTPELAGSATVHATGGTGGAHQ